jgi:hypothetical protein
VFFGVGGLGWMIWCWWSRLDELVWWFGFGDCFLDRSNLIGCCLPHIRFEGTKRMQGVAWVCGICTLQVEQLHYHSMELMLILLTV